MASIWTPVLASIGVLGAALLTYLGVRFTARSARTATIDTDSSEWERRYRANAERHMRWDFMIQGRLLQVQQKVGIDDPIEDPPPLFPEPTAKD